MGEYTKDELKVLNLVYPAPGPSLSRLRYTELRNLAWQVLIEAGINELPVKLGKICRFYNVIIFEYGKDAAKVEIIDKESLRLEREAFSIFIGGRDIICYKNIPNLQRLRWTVAHELGHILLKHSKFSDIDYEREAHMFARRLLAPMCVLKECGISSAKELSALCDISAAAAAGAFERYEQLIRRDKFYLSSLERKLVRQFEGYIKNKQK